MGIFDFIKKTPQTQGLFEPIQNTPEVLTTRLLYYKKPAIDVAEILEELKLIHKGVESSGKDNTLLFFFPDIKIHFADASIPAQLTILNDQGAPITEIDEGSLQQNWHWKEATQTANNCKYEILISDLMTRTLDYKTRVDLYFDFLVTIIKVTNPQVAHSLNSQKLISPADLVTCITSADKDILHGLVNVRLFNISNGQKGEIIMDTIGMHSLGLPDFQIKFANLDESEVAGLLWNYLYYVYENGDVIQSGNTLQGLSKTSKWKSEKQQALIDPERVVINMHVN